MRCTLFPSQTGQKSAHMSGDIAKLQSRVLELDS